MQLEIVNKEYSPEMAQQLTPALGEYSKAVLGEIKRGLSHIWQIKNTLYVVRIERDVNGLEMVVVAAVGEGLKETSQRVVEQAEQIGCYSIRFHTQRPALVGLMGLPFRESERVYRMAVGGEYGAQ